MSFEPRGRSHSSLLHTSLDSSVSLALAGGVGSTIGGATSGTRASFVGKAANAVPACVLLALAAAARRDEVEEAKRKEDGDEPDYRAGEDAVQTAYDARCLKYGCPLGGRVSLRERQEVGKVDDHSLLYGEISTKSLFYCLRKIALWHGLPGRGHTPPRSGVLQLGGGPGTGGRFVDVGAGLGKACVLAALCHPFDAVTGVEILEGLHVASVELVKECLNVRGPGATSSMACMNVEMLHGDATDRDVFDWSAADVVLIHGATFGVELMEKIALICDDLKVGSFVLTVSKTVPSAGLAIVEEVKGEFSWGEGSIFIMQRKPEEEAEEAEAEEDS